MFEKKITLDKEKLVILMHYLDINSVTVFKDLSDKNKDSFNVTFTGGNYYVIPEDDGVSFHINILYTLTNIVKSPIGRTVSFNRMHQIVKKIMFKK